MAARRCATVRRMTVDLNCDLGEGTAWDGELMPLITSANIACGAHAGDLATMKKAVELAHRNHVGVGAHPGFADREHFGRREIPLTPRELARQVIAQIEALRELGPVRHVKPHGALYNLAARERGVADVIANAVLSVDPSLILFGLANSQLVAAGRAKGLPVAEEVFADRTYQANGSLTPRTEAAALISTEAAAVAQVRRMVHDGVVIAVDGTTVRVRADTVCVHGDGERAVALAQALRHALEADGVTLRPFTA